MLLQIIRHREKLMLRHHHSLPLHEQSLRFRIQRHQRSIILHHDPVTGRGNSHSVRQIRLYIRGQPNEQFIANLKSWLITVHVFRIALVTLLIAALVCVKACGEASGEENQGWFDYFAIGHVVYSVVEVHNNYNDIVTGLSVKMSMKGFVEIIYLLRESPLSRTLRRTMHIFLL